MLRRSAKVILAGSASLLVWFGVARFQASTVAAADRGDAVVAKFAGGQITVADVERAAANKIAQVRVRYAGEGGRERLLTELVRWELLLREAERRGYADSSVVYEATTKAAVASMEAELVVDPASIASDDVAKHYAAHRAEFHIPAARRASLIKLATAAEARALIDELAGVSRARFAALATERSIDEATNRQGGELGYFDRQGRQRAKNARRRVAPALAESAFALASVGSVSELPVPYAGGFAVLMLTGELRAVDRALAQAEGEIREQLAAARTEQMVDELLERLREEHQPQVHRELLGLISLDDAPRRDIPHGFPAAPPNPYAPTPTVEPDEI